MVGSLLRIGRWKKQDFDIGRESTFFINKKRLQLGEKDCFKLQFNLSWLFLCLFTNSDVYCKVFWFFFSLCGLTTNFLFNWKPWMFSVDYRRGVCFDDFGCWIWKKWKVYAHNTTNFPSPNIRNWLVSFAIFEYYII